jgi:cytochrome c-type biogenesis protein CcmH/NrfG
VEKATGKVKQRGRVALARCYFKNPRWGKQAEETLLAVAREEPKNVSANLLLAALYRDRGLRTRALAKYRLVLELSPENEEAAAYLAEHAPAPPPEEAEGGGLLKKLFRKG